MNTNHNLKRGNYVQPLIQKIVLDNAISLQLESNPPTLPNEVRNTLPTTEQFSNNPLI